MHKALSTSVAMLSESSALSSDCNGVEKTLCDVLVRFAVVLVNGLEGQADSCGAVDASGPLPISVGVGVPDVVRVVFEMEFIPSN